MILDKHKHHERLVHCQETNNYQGDILQFILNQMQAVSMIIVTFLSKAPIYPFVVHGKQQSKWKDSPKVDDDSGANEVHNTSNAQKQIQS
jgi:hypothetical protein